MDLSNPWSLLSGSGGLALGLIGMALFIHGKKQADLRRLWADTILCVSTYLIASQAVLWVIAVAVMGGAYWMGRE